MNKTNVSILVYNTIKPKNEKRVGIKLELTMGCQINHIDTQKPEWKPNQATPSSLHKNYFVHIINSILFLVLLRTIIDHFLSPILTP